MLALFLEPREPHTALAEPDFLSLVRNRDHDGLSTAWDAATSEPGDVEIYSQTLTELCDRSQHAVALDLGTRMVDALEQKNRLEDAITLGSAVIRKDAHSESFARNVLGLIERHFGNEPWYDVLRSISGLSTDNLSRDAFGTFDRARRMTPGLVVYHRAGWNEGLVKGLDPDERTLEIAFVGGQEKAFPLDRAIETLRPLEKDDLRAMRLLDPEQLQQTAEADPPALIRMAAKIYRGTITSTQVKSELSPSVIPTKKWAGWWKKAKTAASNDPWLEVAGSKTRPVFELRKQPLSLIAEAEKRFGHCQNVPEVIETCREYLARGVDDAGKAQILDLTQAQVEAEVAKNSDTPAHLLDGILFLEEQGRTPSVSAAHEVKQLVLGEDGAFSPEAFDNLATQESKEHAVRLLPEALGESWADHCAETLIRFPAPLVEQVAGMLTDAKHGARLVTLWPQVAPFPRKHPTVTYLLARLYADGVFEGREEAPELLSLTRVVMHLCRVVSKERKSDEAMARIRARVTSLMVGRRNLLGRAMEVASRDDIAGFLGIAERGGSDFPQEITDAILRVVADKYPDITKKPEKPFWLLDEFVYVTAAGLARQKEEHRVLVDEKIPLNAQAIHQAASYGDLSENSEWEAAMEEQRNLTGRAEEMSQQLRKARLIEDQEIPEGKVAPGTKVHFRYLDAAEHDGASERTIRILGPWDCIEEDIVNYKAPLAKALLGLEEGTEAAIQVPEGERRVRIESVEAIV